MEEGEYNEVTEYDVLTPDQSADALMDYIQLTYDMGLDEVRVWLEEIEDVDPKHLPETLWRYDSTNAVGLGLVNYPQKDFPVGIYFKHPRWREGKICRVNNHIDIEVFLNIATTMRRELRNKENS
jgi:hypothetical protein